MQLKLLGFIVGFFSAGIGVGGGAIMVPIFISLFKFDFRKAASTSLATIIPISLIGAMGHIILSKQTIPVTYFLLFIPACILGVILGGVLLRTFKTNYLKLAFTIFILIAGLKMLGAYDFSFFIFDILKEASLWGYFTSIFIFGIIAGFTATLLGVGCGLIIVPFFVIMIGLDMHTAITLSLTSMFFLTMTATIVHKKHKVLCKKTIQKTIPAALLGAVTGVLVSSYLPGSTLKKAFGVFLLLVSVKFLIEEFKSIFLKIKKETNNGSQQVQ
ncbi:sulfite exporter TauE/SafE family protein [bacterium]|nr:sulfite exporter TauE/SafE family protein [bacterium]